MKKKTKGKRKKNPSKTSKQKLTDNLTTTGKQFYTWGTLGSFGGASGAVIVTWAALKRVGPLNSEAVPFLVSVIIMAALAYFTEPEKGQENTTWRQKGQKIVITILNSFLVYLSAVGFDKWYVP